MLWTILVIGLTLAVTVIGQMGGGLIHLLLAGATVILVIQLFSLLFSPSFSPLLFLRRMEPRFNDAEERQPIPEFLQERELAFFESTLTKEG